MPPPDRSAAVPSPPPRQPRRPRGPTVELSISSDPKTTVYRGSRRLGVTPLKIRIPKTKTKFLLRNRKKGIRTTRVITPHGSRISAHFVFRKGKIGFRTSTRCEVRLGRKRLGITPLSPVEVYEGKHKVLLVEKRGGRRHRRTVDVMPGRTVWVEVK